MLVERGAHVNAVNADGVSVLDAASNTATSNFKKSNFSRRKYVVYKSTRIETP